MIKKNSKNQFLTKIDYPSCYNPQSNKQFKMASLADTYQNVAKKTVDLRGTVDPNHPTLLKVVEELKKAIDSNIKKLSDPAYAHSSQVEICMNERTSDYSLEMQRAIRMKLADSSIRFKVISFGYYIIVTPLGTDEFYDEPKDSYIYKTHPYVTRMVNEFKTKLAAQKAAEMDPNYIYRPDTYTFQAAQINNYGPIIHKQLKKKYAEMGFKITIYSYKNEIRVMVMGPTTTYDERTDSYSDDSCIIL